MTEAILYHNPRCSKSRATLKLLEANNVETTIIEYLKNPPSEEDIQRILSKLNISPRELLRSDEQAYKEQQLDQFNLSDSELIQAMIKNPILIQRPIVLANGKAIIGRPPEQVLTIIDL